MGPKEVISKRNSKLLDEHSGRTTIQKATGSHWSSEGPESDLGNSGWMELTIPLRWPEFSLRKSSGHPITKGIRGLMCLKLPNPAAKGQVQAASTLHKRPDLSEAERACSQ